MENIEKLDKKIKITRWICRLIAIAAVMLFYWILKSQINFTESPIRICIGFFVMYLCFYCWFYVAYIIPLKEKKKYESYKFEMEEKIDKKFGYIEKNAETFVDQSKNDSLSTTKIILNEVLEYGNCKLTAEKISDKIKLRIRDKETNEIKSSILIENDEYFTKNFLFKD